jgi:hypothetical protein
MYVLFTVGVGFLVAWRYGHSLTVWLDPNSPTDLLGGI